MVWTRFMDMCSGGGLKLPWEYIYIEAPQKDAEVIFQNRFGRNPYRVTCTCCGEDYSVGESNDLARITAFERGCAFADGQYIEKSRDIFYKYTKLEDYIINENVKVIYAHEITLEDHKCPRDQRLCGKVKKRLHAFPARHKRGLV